MMANDDKIGGSICDGVHVDGMIWGSHQSGRDWSGENILKWGANMEQKCTFRVVGKSMCG